MSTPRTSDGFEVTVGLRVFTSDFEWGVVTELGAPCEHGAAWHRVALDSTGSRSYDGSRLATAAPIKPVRKPSDPTKWDLIDDEQRAGLDGTPCGLACSSCGTLLVTEGDFARHFKITDQRFLNLGYCPDKDRS